MFNKILLLLFILFCLLQIKNYEHFWPILDSGEWFKLNRKKYYWRISHNLITRLDCKLNLYDIIKNEYYSPISIVDFDKNTRKYPPKSLWFIKYRSGGGGKFVYPIFYKNIKNKLNELNKKKETVQKCHTPASYKEYMYIIQKEIPPMLIDGRKSDMRIFYIIMFRKNTVKFYLGKDGFIKINNKKYVKNSINKSIQLTNNAISKAPTNILISEHKDHKLIMSKLVDLFTNLSKKIKLEFRNLNSDYEIEYQICGADVMFDNKLNPYLLELNSGWPGYIKKSNPVGVKRLKRNTKKEISEIVYNYLNNKPINNKYLTELKV